jgi:hypothetical protein
MNAGMGVFVGPASGKDREAFLTELKFALTQMGYHEKARREIYLIFEGSLLSQAITPGANVQVQMEKGSATRLGPQKVVERLEMSKCLVGEEKAA